MEHITLLTALRRLRLLPQPPVDSLFWPAVAQLRAARQLTYLDTLGGLPHPGDADNDDV